MHTLATYIMRGRLQAAIVTGLFGALAWMFPPFILISCAALGLVILRQNLNSGIVVLTGATLFCGVASSIRFGTPLLALFMVFAIWLPIWVTAMVLKTVRSQTVVLIVVMIMSLMLAAGVRFFAGGIESYWQQSLTKHAEKVVIVADADQQIEVIKTLAVLMNGFVAASFGLMVIMSLLLARWWQSLLYNPAGFGTEFRSIQLPTLITVPILISAVLVAIVKLAVPPYGLILDFLIIGITVSMFHGLAIVHYFVRERQLGTGWFSGLYFFLVAAAVYVFSVLAMLAIADSFSDYRKLRNETA